jgi:hypothetical protein
MVSWGKMDVQIIMVTERRIMVGIAPQDTQYLIATLMFWLLYLYAFEIFLL